MEVLNVISEKRILPALDSLAQALRFTKSRPASEQNASFKRYRRKKKGKEKRVCVNIKTR